MGEATQDDFPDQPHYFLYRQAAYAVVGHRRSWSLVARFDYSRLRELKYGLYTVMIGLVLIVLVVGGTDPRLAARAGAAVLLLPALRAGQAAADRRAVGVRRRPRAPAARPRHDGAHDAGRAVPGRRW